MAKINVLSKELAELIAAGEVVERPASVVKELIENSIDAKATHITVEIARGGIEFIRITDDGCGIEASDVRNAFLRHATSKISSQEDLYAISSLGFRGEALAATSSVSRVELFTKAQEESMGTHYVIEGGNEILCEESGCPQGTTIIIRDLFYNTPARMKFLKKDVSEGNSCTAVVERAALSHPEISFKLIREGKATLSSTGDGKLESAIYSILGREFSKSLIEAKGETQGIEVSGFVTKPVFCRQSRANQYTFLNGRLVRSGTVTAAVEQAYKNSAMVGKFPGFVLMVKVPFESVDVNVHPAKTEVRFADEKRVFDGVYYAVKNALTQKDTRPVIAPKTNYNVINRMPTEEYVQQRVNIPETVAEKVYERFIEKPATFKKDNTPFFERKDVREIVKQKATEIPQRPIQVIKEDIEEKREEKIKTSESITIEENPQEEVIFIGEAFSTYIVAQKGNSIFLIDKHAAHERILFNKLKESEHLETQQLLVPVSVRLSGEELDAVSQNTQLFEKLGFEIEDFGNSTVLVRAIPAMLMGDDVEAIVVEAAAALKEKGVVEVERMERIYHTVACKAAIKAGMHTSTGELSVLAKRVLEDKEIMYCPHGRPVAFEIKKRELEKQFGRIQ